MADKNVKAEKGAKADRSTDTDRGSTVRTIRTRIAQVVWLLFVVAALFLAVGALCVALDFNQKNDLVQFAIDGADAVDLGVFSRMDGIKQFTGDGAETKNALFNWGIGAIAWLLVGRILERLIRP